MSPNFDLDAAHWAALRRLLDAALALPTPQRAAWLERLQGDDAALAPRLRALLAHSEDDARSPLDAVPGVETAQILERVDGSRWPTAGQTIGPYRLVRHLGEGGMGSVWLGERADGLVRRPVALKFPRLHADRHGLEERLARERDFLAALDHPNIARLYDAGIGDDGRPFLALEYVEGERIDRYCDQHALDTRARVRLFAQVADAVAHAHAKLIIHRDLKPANILVAADGQARLLDFGIAKLLEDGRGGETELTQLGGRALTPQYAAPEQVAGQPLSVAADVYSLGVVLYELLAGQLPYQPKRATAAALEEEILRASVALPSTVAKDPAARKALRGDLDTIVAKALKKLPAERYATVEALGEDLRRFLTHRAVLARPDSVWYRARKFVVRNRAAVGVGAGVTAALVVTAAVALGQANEARLQRDAALEAKARADQEAQAARAAERVAEAQADLASFVLSDFADQHADEEMVAQLDNALVMVRAQYRDDPVLRAELLMAIGDQFRWISEQRRAEAVFAEAAPLVEANADPAALARLRCVRAAVQAREGKHEAARALLAQAAAVNTGQTARHKAVRTQCLLEEALILRYAGEPAAAIARTEEAIRLLRAVGRGQREDTSEALADLARAQLEAGRYADALRSARQSIALIESIGRTRTPGLHNAWGLAAVALRDGGRPLEAERAHRENGRLDPAVAGVAAPSRGRYGTTLLALGRTAEGLAVLDVAIKSSIEQGAPLNAAFLELDAAAGAAAAGRVDNARARLARAAPAFARARADKRVQAASYAVVAAIVALAGKRAAEAEAALTEAREAFERNPGTPALSWRHYHRSVASLELLRGDTNAALAAIDKALALSVAHALDPAGSLDIGEDLLLRAEVRYAAGDRTNAAQDATLAARHLRDAAGAQHPGVVRAEKLATQASLQR